ncbi:MAG: prepilin-type N-terminal cleavage/methylation domain-containing protein, partial [Bacilli bacterium]
MKKNKGFTLIELLAVIVVLAIILVIAIININGYIKKAKEQANIITVSAISKAAKNYYGENAVLKNFPITISLPDKNNVLKLENAENIYGYVKINEDGKVELIVNIKDNTYLKNYNNANAFNLNDSKYVYEGSSKQWIVSKYNPSKLILWKPIENNIGIQSLVDEYIFLSYYYYTELESSFVNTASFQHDITKGKDMPKASARSI